MTLFHRIWLIIIALIGILISCLSFLLAIPAMIGLNPTVFLLLVPLILIIWDITILIRGKKIKNLKYNLLFFYIVTGLISIWCSTLTFNRDGVTGYIFDQNTGYLLSLFFLVPIIVLLFSKPNIEFTDPTARINSE